MRVGEAKEIAREWVRTGVGRLPGFHGAFIAGSTAYLPEDALISGNSDVDVKIIIDDPPDTGGPQKLLIHGVVLDVSYARTAEVSSADLVLGSYYTAPHFAAGASCLIRPEHLLPSKKWCARNTRGASGCVGGAIMSAVRLKACSIGSIRRRQYTFRR